MKIILKEADFSANNVGKIDLDYVNLLNKSSVLPLNGTEVLGKPKVTKMTAEAPINGVDAFELTFTRAIQTGSSNFPYLVLPDACLRIPENNTKSIVLGLWTTQHLYGANAVSGLLIGNNSYASSYGQADVRSVDERSSSLSSVNVIGTWKGKVVEEKEIEGIIWKFVCVILKVDSYTDAAAGAKPLILPGFNAYDSWFNRSGNTDDSLKIKVQNITMCYGDEYLDPYKVY
jgi:hypothetical protein